ncbi:MAG: inositol monophosphatase family protein [Actinomycetota bacterium]
MSEQPTDLELLLSLGDLADEITLGSWRSSVLSTRTKADGSPVTPVDIEVERSLRDRVLEVHPDDGFVSEELGMTDGSSGRTWHVDGIDGTRAYADGRTEWSTLIAITDPGGIRQALCTGPALARRWYVDAKGQAVRAGSDGEITRVQVAAPADRGARVACWPPAGRIGDHVPHQGQSRLETLTAGRSTRPSWDAGVPNAAMLVAEGALDGFVLAGGGPWDHAATAAIVAAAGGTWSDLSGHRDLHSSVIVLTNGTIHDWLLAQLGPDDPSAS